MEKFFIITQIKSKIGILPKHKAILKGLGLRRINHTVKRKKNKSILGMINKISYMLKVR
ncbi:MAG: 50S ribosomal protein L30 [Buchnera aphidicola (Periphyllus lyropictus)]|uniref:50S ribosomal protein L30 n=1 Tax=Buchnera aphidicola TaxID=9 RepID=UPI001EBBA1EB|nr:50S ribosomal protein L30 [Buchnera aphidicola]NIH16491.1 50S ribosomal protein L30 [Buchnera aphidicola (Periphyllus lyropictus)]USS94776.1 50S ribosomal protein L30 [Buchnera aphidicola (Periphyllus lyropictus)]